MRSLAATDSRWLSELSSLDRSILLHASRLLSKHNPTFDEALDALTAAVEAHIASGRVFVLRASAPFIAGSLISGIGITEREGSIVVVRYRHEVLTELGFLQ